MEVQRATIATLRSFVDKMSSANASASTDPNAPSPLEVVLGLKPDPAKKKADKKAARTEPGDSAEAPGAESAASPFNAAAQSASQAWWNLLQQQFDNIAAATTASMAGTQPGAPSQPNPASAQPAAAAKAAARPARKKAAARKPAEPSSS